MQPMWQPDLYGRGSRKSSFLTICKEWGYFSERKDGTVHRMDLCESCYDAWVRTFAIAPEVEQKTELI